MQASQAVSAVAKACHGILGGILAVQENRRLEQKLKRMAPQELTRYFAEMTTS